MLDLFDNIAALERIFIKCLRGVNIDDLNYFENTMHFKVRTLI